jgi:hypothetical protein
VTRARGPGGGVGRRAAVLASVAAEQRLGHTPRETQTPGSLLRSAAAGLPASSAAAGAKTRGGFTCPTVRPWSPAPGARRPRGVERERERVRQGGWEAVVLPARDGSKTALAGSKPA